MFKTKIEPRFGDVDGLGHINNTVIPVWFEQARNPIYKFFTPDLDLKKWELTLAKIEVEFVRELFYAEEVEIRTYLLEIGYSAMTIGQKAVQNGKVGARGKTVIVHYDFEQKKSIPIPVSIRELLQEHLLEEE